MSTWLAWSIIGLGPSLVVAWLAVRGARSGSVDAWQDWRDAAEVGDWLIAGLAVLAGIALSEFQEFEPASLALLTAIPIFVYVTAQHLSGAAYWASKDLRTPVPLRTILGNYLRDLGSPLGITAYLLCSAFAAEGAYVPAVGVKQFLILTGSSWLGAVVFNLGRSKTAYMPGKWKLLAPCELYTRIAEIASRIGVSIDEVRIIIEMPFRWAGGLARSSSGIVLTEDLLTGLPKGEVDAVVAHELGHAAHSNYWWLYWPRAILAWLLALAAASAAEIGIRALPAAYHSLNYVLWLALFMLPKIVHCWYRRRGERGANLWLRVLEDRAAAISGYRRLAVIDKLSTSRPWWSRVLSTHPYIGEEISRIARDAGISDEALAEAIHRGDSELPEDFPDRYVPVFHEERDREALKRPKTARKGEVDGWLGGAIAMLVIAGVAFAVAASDVIGATLAIVAAIALVVALSTGAYFALEGWYAAKWRKFREEAMAAMADLYPQGSASDMLLLDAIRIDEWDAGKWQCALAGVTDGEFVVLGELGEEHIATAQVTDLGIWKSRGAQSQVGVALWYAVEGASQWVVLRPLGRPPKGEPKNTRALERWMRERLLAQGADLPEREREKAGRLKAIALRIPVAVAILAMTALLMWGVGRMLELNLGFIAYYLVLGTAGSALWSWVAAAGSRKRRL